MIVAANNRNSVATSHATRRIVVSTAIVLLLAVSIILPVQAQTGAYTLNGGSASDSNKTYSATGTDQSAVYVLNSGNLNLKNCTITKTGDAFYVTGETGNWELHWRKGLLYRKRCRFLNRNA